MFAVDVPRERQCHAKRHFGHRGREDRAGGKDVNATPEAFGIVNVRQEVGLDVEDRPQVRRQGQPVRRHRLLRDQDLGLGQVAGVECVAILALPFGHLVA